MKTRLDFDAMKTCQVAAMLIKLSGRSSMDKLKLVKLLYLVDRKSFEDRARPIMGGKYVSMEHGPVPSDSLNLINTEPMFGETLWTMHFEKGGAHKIKVKSDPGDNELSRREIGIIQSVFEEFGSVATYDLRNLTHELPEYEEVGKTSKEIPLERLLLKVRGSRKDAKRIAGEIESRQFLLSLASK